MAGKAEINCENLTNGHPQIILQRIKAGPGDDLRAAIIDAVRPTRTFYALETMPGMFPDSTDSYVRLIDAIDRAAFAVHFDPVNLICSPQRYFNNAAIIEEFCRRLGGHIRGCHAKDILLHDRLTVHLDEACPGDGGLDYAAYLREIAKLDADTPICLEHMATEADYDRGAAYIRGIAGDLGLEFK